MDAEAFDEFYAASSARVVGQVYALVGNRDEAQECVQEAFVRAWSHRRQLDSAQAPEAWVRTTAYRLAVSRWRRTVRARRDPDRALQPEKQGTPLDAERVALVKARLARGRAALLALLGEEPTNDLTEGVGRA